MEAGELTGADDLLPVLESGQPPRSPDPDSAVSPTIVCRILVGTDGAVREASIFRSRLDLAKFEEAALSTVKSYRFRPGRRGGRTVPVWINYPVTFS